MTSKTLPSLLAVLLALGSAAPALADRDDHDRYDRHDRQQRHDRRDTPYRSGHWLPDAPFRQQMHYPAVGHSVTVLPPGHIRLRGSHLHYHGGIWFRPDGRRYVVVIPPPGVVIPILPPAYSVVWYRASPYYYANGIYYTAAPGGYAVTSAPPLSDVVLQPVEAEDGLQVYPKHDQDPARMAADRAECTTWAVNQTGYDPARSSPTDVRRDDFQRAAATCLEARDYAVR